MKNKILLCLMAGLGLILPSQKLLAESDIKSFEAGVVTHVLYHELAHALIREFQLPVLANEEAMADAFATIWITQFRRDDAPEIIIPRVRSWILEDQQRSSQEYDFKGEHQPDIRRAYQTACLFYGADPTDWGQLVSWLEFSENDLADCSDTAPDHVLGWEYILKQAFLPAEEFAQNVEVIYGDGPLADTMRASGVIERFAEDVKRFDWPNGITIHFDHCDQGAYWDRSTRVILLCDDYVERFIKQGAVLASQN